MRSTESLRKLFGSDVGAVIAQRTWQAAGGLVTLALVAHYLSPVQQGWYYSFLSVAALHTLFDLGLSVVLVQVSAHYSVGLARSDNARSGGDGRARFDALSGRSFYLYLRLALFFIAVILPAGLWFFGHEDSARAVPGGHWRYIWTALVLATAANVLLMPFQSLLEGAGGITEIYLVRLAQGIAGSVACWCVLIFGGGLWAVVMVPAFSLGTGLVWLRGRQWGLVVTAVRHMSATFDWRGEVWTLQWRLGLSWLAAYLVSQIFTPLLFHERGAVVAGQMGLSLAVANMLSLIAQSWITRRVPRMAQSVAKGEWASLDKMFARDFAISLAVFLIGTVGACGVYWALSGTRYHSRVLPFLPFAGLLGTTLLRLIVGALVTQLRSFRREPLMWVSAASAVLTVLGAGWAARPFGAGGVVAVMFSVQLVVALPISIVIWRRCNRAWRVPQ